MKLKGRVFLAVLAVATAIAVPFAQEAPAARAFRLPRQGSLQLSTPARWKVASESGKESSSVYIRVDAGNQDIDVQITAFVLDAAQLARMTPTALRGAVEAQGKTLLSQSVETELAVQELRAASGAAFYYALTDRAPGPAGYKYLIQGSQLAGEALVTFTILHRAPNPPEVQQALQMLGSATYSK